MDPPGINVGDRIEGNSLQKPLALAFAVVKSNVANMSLHGTLRSHLTSSGG